MKVLIATGCLLLVSYVSALSVSPQEWHSFKALYGKSYSNRLEEELRMKVYLENKKQIEEHNRAYENGKVTYKLKMNHFGDLMSHEFKAMMNGLKNTGTRNGELYVPSNSDLPKSVDWRSKGAVTPVKNQGQCGSCWAFSSTGSLEGQMFLRKGKSVSLSEQNLVDCSSRYGNAGCNGGLMDQAFQYIKENSGIDTEDSYPYEAEGGTCRFKETTVGGTDNGFKDIPQGDEKALQDAIANVGPVSVAIDAGKNSFQFYSEGIYNDPRCSSENLDHGVLAVGYGNEKGQDYWIVKNSWGSSWGEQGYIKMARNKNNLCGIASSASYPIV